MPAIVNLLFNTVSTNTTIAFTVALPVVSLACLLAGVGGHLLLWLVLARNPRTRSKPGSVLLLNLSLADLGALLTLPCVLLGAGFRDWRLGDGACVVLGFVTSVTVGAEIFSLSALRYRLVAPRTRAPANLTQVRCTVVAIWLVSVAMAVPKVTYIDFDGGCTWLEGRDEWLSFLVPAFLVYYVAPLLCIAVNCGLVVSHLRGCRGVLAADGRNRKATALLTGSTLVFVLSWLPYYALEFANVMSPRVGAAASPIGSSEPPGPGNRTEAGVSLLWEVSTLSAILLVCLAPCWNPPLYFLLSRPAVRQLRALLPSVFRTHAETKMARRWRVAPAPALPRPLQPPRPLAHQHPPRGPTR